MNVLYLHQHFATRAGAGGTRSYEFARHLLRQGHTVTMVTGMREAGGVAHEARQVIDGIEVISLGGWYSNKLSAGQRIRQFLRFSWHASRLRERDLPVRPDVVIATSTPLTIGIPGNRLARRFGVPFVFEVRDLWPQAPIELGKLRNPLARAAARWLERRLYRQADHIIALSPGMERGVLEAGTPGAKVTTIPNASDIDLFGPDRRDRSLLARFGVGEGTFVAVHAGSMGEANGLGYLVEAARVLHERGERDVRIMICGYGGTRDRLEATCGEYGLDNVIFTGSIPRAELGAIVSSVDAAIVSFADYPVLATNSPNKFFDGLAAGIPNIVNSPGWTRDIVLEDDAGAYVDVKVPTQLADALVALRDDPALRERQGRNARRLAETRFERIRLAGQFCAVLEDAVRARGGDPVARVAVSPPAAPEDAAGGDAVSTRVGVAAAGSEGGR